MRGAAGTVERPMEPWACRWPDSPQAPGCCGFDDPPVAVEAHQFAEADTLWLAGVFHGLECPDCGGSRHPCVRWATRFPTGAR